MRPEVGIISVGAPNKRYRHPHHDVVNRVLLDGSQRAPCVSAPPLTALFQTDNSSKVKGCKYSKENCPSFKGTAVGNIVIRTDGKDHYYITADNGVRQDPMEASAAMRKESRDHPWKSGRCFTLDESNKIC